MIATADKKPVEIVREALTLLTARRLLTPVNYQGAFCLVAGTPNSMALPEGALSNIARAPPTDSRDQKEKRVDFCARGQSTQLG
mgnify:CR=1 FL=1